MYISLEARLRILRNLSVERKPEQINKIKGWISKARKIRGINNVNHVISVTQYFRFNRSLKIEPTLDYTHVKLSNRGKAVDLIHRIYGLTLV